jgi:hypothetical protein
VARTSFGRRSGRATVHALDRLVLAGEALRVAGSPFEVANVVAPAAADLARAAGATVHLQLPGRRLQAVRFGATPPVTPDGTLELVVGFAPPGSLALALPTTGTVGAALTVHGGDRATGPVVADVVRLLALQAAAALDRLAAAAVEPERLDPLTGVGNRQQATADVATVRPGDAVLLVALDGAAPMGSMWGLAAYLRSQTRPPGDTIARLADRELVLVLRDLKSPVGVVADRLLQGWRATEDAPALVMGAAVHHAGAPLETLDRSAAALASARAVGNDRVHVLA